MTGVTPSGHRQQYDSGHDLSVVNVMTRLWRNSLEAAAAVSTIVLATLIVHLVMEMEAQTRSRYRGEKASTHNLASQVDRDVF